MDFKRIEWIFFLAFLGLNIFLFGIYREGQQEESNVSSSTKQNRLKVGWKKITSRIKGHFLQNDWKAII